MAGHERAMERLITLAQEALDSGDGAGWTAAGN